MTREDVLREFGKRVETKESATGLRIHVSSPAHAAAMAYEIVRLRELVAAAAKAWKFVEMNADLCDKGPLGEGWMSREMCEATNVLAALVGDDE